MSELLKFSSVKLIKTPLKIQLLLANEKLNGRLSSMQKFWRRSKLPKKRIAFKYKIIKNTRP